VGQGGKNKINFTFKKLSDFPFIQGVQKVSMHLMITKHNTNWLNLTAWQLTARARGTLDSH
jgi:hypothetical protein